MSHMSFTTELAAVANDDVVVEAAIENLDIKKSVFAELDSLCKPEPSWPPTRFLHLHHRHRGGHQDTPRQVHRHALL